jgi:hypothetical protein
MCGNEKRSDVNLERLFDLVSIVKHIKSALIGVLKDSFLGWRERLRVIH